MTHIFITCISALRKNPQIVQYNKGYIEALQTNEACCKYLLKRGPRPDVVLALCTRDAVKQVIDGEYIRSYDHFKKSICTFCRENEIKCPDFRKVRLRRSEERKNHFGRAISELMSNVKEIGERENTCILIDTAGGLRNINIMIQTMTRLLHYEGYDRVEAYYTNWTEKRIYQDHTNRQLNITEAIAAFAEHGTTHKLKEFFSRSRCQAVQDLVQAMVDFSDSIRLCKTEHLPEIVSQRIFPALDEIESLRGAQANKEDIAALQQMVNYIRFRFGYNPFGNQDVTPISLIKWCLDCGYVQQAVTLFTENIPKYLVESNTLIVKNPDYYPALNGNTQHGTWLYCDLIDGFLNDMQQDADEIDELKLYLQNPSIKFKTANPKVQEIITSLERMKTEVSLNNLSIALAYYEPKNYTERVLLSYIKGHGFNKFSAVLSSIRVDSVLMMKLLRKEAAPKRDEISRKIEGIRNFRLQQLNIVLPDFELNISEDAEEDFRFFLMYYVYIKKKIRNHLNHASDDEHTLTAEQNAAFSACGIDTGDLTPKNITNNLLNAMKLFSRCIKE